MKAQNFGLISIENPQTSEHGGTLRSRAFLDAFAYLSLSCDVFYVGKYIDGQRQRKSISEDREPALLSPLKGGLSTAKKNLGAAKRRFIPMPTFMGARSSELMRQLQASSAQVVVSSVITQAPLVLDSGKRLWLDFSDLWSSFCMREAEHRLGLASATSRLQARWLRSREFDFAARAAVVTTAGFADHQALTGFGVQSTWLPTGLGSNVHPQRLRSMDVITDKKHGAVGFLGNFDYWPNRDALHVLLSDWLPHIHESGFIVIIAGRGADRLGSLPRGVINLGELKDVSAFYSAVDAVVAPIRLGGGIKVKVVESLLYGKPVIGTAAALEGLSPETGDLCITFDDYDSLRRALIRLPSRSWSDGDPRLRPYTLNGFRESIKKLVERI